MKGNVRRYKLLFAKFVNYMDIMREFLEKFFYFFGTYFSKTKSFGAGFNNFERSIKMDYKEISKHLAQNDDEYIFLSSVCDRIIACEKKNIITATKFLDARQLALSKQLLKDISCKNHVFDGGVPDAERMICVFLPDYPVTHELFKFIRAGKSARDILTHRDYLGSLLSLGIERDCIGDIFVHEGGADIVVLSKIADFITLEYKKAGKKQLLLSYISNDEMNISANDFKIIKVTVPSMRLDAIAGTVFKLSRSDSANLIKKGKILLNSAECMKPDKAVDEGDKITVRGKGKAEIILVAGKTKKDKFILEIKVFGKK